MTWLHLAMLRCGVATRRHLVSLSLSKRHPRARFPATRLMPVLTACNTLPKHTSPLGSLSLSACCTGHLLSRRSSVNWQHSRKARGDSTAGHTRVSGPSLGAGGRVRPRADGGLSRTHPRARARHHPRLYPHAPAIPMRALHWAIRSCEGARLSRRA